MIKENPRTTKSITKVSYIILNSLKYKIYFFKKNHKNKKNTIHCISQELFFNLYTCIITCTCYKIYVQGNVVLNQFVGMFSGRFATLHGYLSPYKSV